MEDKIRDFMARVVPWPGDMSSPGYVNLIWTPGFHGKPFKSLTEFLKWAVWAADRKTIKDIYYCLSLQAEASRNGRGNISAKRHSSLALSLKAVWLDIDVKAPPKGYNTLADAILALNKFRADCKLPPPSALVHSGGGLHVYWISDRALPKAEWEPYAQGLKTLAIKHGLRCDAGVTVDAARILRVPGTKNYKTDPAKPVKLLALREQSLDYDFPSALKVLSDTAPTLAVVPQEQLFIEPNQPRASALLSALPQETLSEGLEKYVNIPLNPLPIMKGCAFLRDALLTGGKDYDQPMWNLTTLAATFLENGHELAHKMGKAHVGYNRGSTDQLWDRKNKERSNKNLGYPSCAAIQTAGCKACADCAVFKLGKSPLNLSQPVTPPALKIVGDDLQLPKDYMLNKEGYICQEVIDKEGNVEWVRLFYSKLSKPWIGGNPKALCFTTTADLGVIKPVVLPLSIMANRNEMWASLFEQEVTPVVRQKVKCEEFFMAWLDKIQKAKKATLTVPFGWLHESTENKVKRCGFVYGGVLYKDDGTEQPAGQSDPETRAVYSPSGSRDAWVDACKMITNMQRPELECIVAAAFAAPLAFVPGEYSSMLSIWGDSGAGKSTAVKVGMGVWSNPKLSKEVALSTAKHIVKKMGDIRNLPVYHDEIKDEKAQNAVFTTLFSGSEGVEGGKLNSNSTHKSRGDWQTMMVICSNLSFVDYLNKAQKTTDAGIYRVFEYTLDRGDSNAPGILPTSMDATRVTQELEHNFGVIGMEYAKMLGRDPDGVDAFTKNIVTNFSHEMKATNAERYWVAACGTLLAGAELANRLGANFNLKTMREFLKAKYQMNRERCEAANVKGGTQMNTEEALTGFFKAHVGETLRTDIHAQGRGKPKGIQEIHGPRLDIPRPINVQWAITERICLISRAAFHAYLDEVKTPPAQILRGLKKYYSAEIKRTTLGAGTSYVQTQEYVICIPVPEGSPLEAVMNAYKQITV